MNDFLFVYISALPSFFSSSLTYFRAVSCTIATFQLRSYHAICSSDSFVLSLLSLVILTSFVSSNPDTVHSVTSVVLRSINLYQLHNSSVLPSRLTSCRVSLRCPLFCLALLLLAISYMFLCEVHSFIIKFLTGKPLQDINTG